MGSVCCVPAKPQRSAGSHDRWPVGPSEPRWRMNGNFSPPFSNRWDDKSLPDDATASANGMHLYRSSFSSSSRGSRRGSSRYPGHQRALSGGLFSQDASPSSSFRASHLNPLASSQICPVDLLPIPSDSSSSPCMTISSSKEGCLSGALSTVSNTPESTPSFYSNVGEYLHPPTQPPQKQLINSSSHSFISKSLHPLTSHHFSRTVPEKQLCGFTSVGSSRSPLSEGRSSVKRSESGEIDSFTGSFGGTSDWWSMQTFSELVASSRRERLRWMSASSPENFPGLEGMDPTDFLALEKIKACSTQAGSVSPNAEAFVCGLCSRWLSQRSPLSSHKMIGNIDPPSVGVLSCGHVFHADCLEQATSEVERQDPVCPQCASVKKMTRGLDAGDVSKGLFRSYSSHGPANKKLSRIGVVTDDPEMSFRGLHPNVKIFPSSELTKGKSGVQVLNGEKGKSFSKRTFSFKSRQTRDALASDSKTKKTISFSQVSPDNQIDYAPTVGKDRRGSFRYLRGW